MIAYLDYRNRIIIVIHQTLFGYLIVIFLEDNLICGLFFGFGCFLGSRSLGSFLLLIIIIIIVIVSQITDIRVVTKMYTGPHSAQHRAGKLDMFLLHLLKLAKLFH